MGNVNIPLIDSYFKFGLQYMLYAFNNTLGICLVMHLEM